MIEFGLKIPAIETRKTPLTHVLGVIEPVSLTQVLAEDATLKNTVNISSSSSESDDSNFLDLELDAKCNETIVLGGEIHYYHFMAVAGTPGAMCIVKVTAIEPDNKYNIKVSSGDPISRGSKIKRAKELNSSGDLVAILGKRKWQSCERHQCEESRNENVPWCLR